MKITKFDDLLNLNLVGQAFKLDNEKYQFTRFMSKAKSNPVVATRVSDGKIYRFDSVQVARAFGPRNNAA